MTNIEDKRIKIEGNKCIVADPIWGVMSGVLGRPLVRQKVSWETCRESFHRSFPIKGKKRLQGLYCAMIASTSQSILQHRLHHVENGLNLSQRSNVYECVGTSTTYRPFSSIFYIDLSPFWLSRKERFQFFTALIKTLRDINPTYYNPSNAFDIAMRDGEYFRNTFEASRAFLSGRTLYTKTMRYGWRDWFYESLYQESQRYKDLQMPTTKKDTVYFKDNDPQPKWERLPAICMNYGKVRLN